MCSQANAAIAPNSTEITINNPIAANTRASEFHKRLLPIIAIGASINGNTGINSLAE